eukprot:COSAG06_NODE_9284_length_1939_cov_1.044022_2_plen_392_part_00
MPRPLVVFALAALALCAAADVSPSSSGGPSLYAPPPEEAATKLERRRLNPSSRRRSSSFGSYSSYSPSAGVTVTRDNRGYGRRVKDAVGGFVFGLILVCLMPFCIFWNEKDYVYTTKMIKQVAKIDRLPENNSYQAMIMLRHAWDTVDIYTYHAKRSKRVAKVSYILMLLIGATTSIITLISLNEPDMISEEHLALYVTALSLAASFLAAMTTYLDPMQRWMTLRGAALAIESEVWKFRSRCSHYGRARVMGGTQVQEKDSEAAFRESLENVKDHVSKAGAVGETSFYSSIEVFRSPTPNQLRMYSHGQYGCKDATDDDMWKVTCGINGTFGYSNATEDIQDGESDDHHSPLSPDAYLQLRVDPQLRKHARDRAVACDCVDACSLTQCLFW